MNEAPCQGDELSGRVPGVGCQRTLRAGGGDEGVGTGNLRLFWLREDGLSSGSFS